MKINDIISAGTLTVNTGIQILKKLTWDDLIVVNTDVVCSGSAYYGHYFPSILSGPNKRMVHIINDTYTPRVNNLYRLNDSDLIYLSEKILCKSDKILREKVIKEVTNYLKTHSRHNKYFYSGEH